VAIAVSNFSQLIRTYPDGLAVLLRAAAMLGRRMSQRQTLATPALGHRTLLVEACCSRPSRADTLHVEVGTPSPQLARVVQVCRSKAYSTP